MAHDLDDLFSDDDNSFAQHGRWFSDQAKFNEFVHAQRNLYDRLTAVERQEQRTLLEEFLRDGEYPLKEPPVIGAYAGISLEDLLVPSNTPEVHEGVSYLRFDYLLVQQDMFVRFMGTCMGIESENEPLITKTLAALMHGGIGIASPVDNRNKGADNPLDTAIVRGETDQFMPQDHTWQKVEWTANTQFISLQDSARVPSDILMFHELWHAVDAIYNSVAAHVRYNTPSSLFNNHDEKHACRLEGRLLRGRGLAERSVYAGFGIIVSGIRSTALALRVQRDGQAEEIVEDHQVRGTAQRDQTDPNAIIIETENGRQRYHRDDLICLMGMNLPNNVPGRLGQALDTAMTNGDEIRLKLTPNIRPEFKIYPAGLRPAIKDAGGNENDFTITTPSGDQKISNGFQAAILHKAVDYSGTENFYFLQHGKRASIVIEATREDLGQSRADFFSKELLNENRNKKKPFSIPIDQTKGHQRSTSSSNLKSKPRP